MIDGSIKTQKISNVKFTIASSPNATLNDLAKELQILKSEIGTVTDFTSEGDVIFTTQSGESHKLDTDFHLNLGDKVRVVKNEHDEYEAISIFQRKDQRDHHPIIQTYSRNSQEAGAIYRDKSLKVGKILSGIFQESDSDSEESEIELSGKKRNFSKFLKYHFELKSIGSSFNNLYDIENLKTGLLDTLNEILSDDIDSDDTFSGKVIEVNDDEIIVKTLHGNFILSGKHTIAEGTNLVLKLLGEEPLDIDLKFEKIDLMSLINLSKELEIILADIIGKLGTEYTNKILLGLSHILQMAKKNEKLADDISKLLPYSKLEDKNEAQKASNLLSKLIPDFNVIIEETLSKFSPDTWFVSNFTIYYEQESKKQPIYIKREKNNLVRIITDIDLSEIGKIQLDILIKTAKNESNFVQITNMRTQIKHKNPLDKTICEDLRVNFENLIRNISPDSKISFLQTDKFEEISERAGKFEISENYDFFKKDIIL